MNPHTRGNLDQALIALRDDVIRLSTMVDDAIQRSVQALKQQNIDLARQVIVDDQKINKLRYKIEEEAYSLIARQQPAARDLRGIIAAIHIAVDLERMADHASGIATLSLELSKEPLLKPLVDIPRMAEISREMLRDALKAYLDWDQAIARQVITRDKEVDRLDDRVYHDLISHMLKDPSSINRATYLLWNSHNLERIGDHITNICERVIYMVTGEVYYISDLSTHEP